MDKYKFNKTLAISSLGDFEKRLNVKKEVIIRIFKGVRYGYKTKRIKKKNSPSFRELHIPKDFLKNIQDKIYKNLLKGIPLPSCAHGGVEGRDIVTNASCHVKKEWVANIDIEKFFDSVHSSRIFAVFKALDCSEEVSKILTGLTTYNHCLPQGAPTSPYLSNLVLVNLDKRFMKLCKRNNIVYTRYFDDITISGSRRVVDEKMKSVYQQIIKTEKYKINYKKMEFYHKTGKQKVNGILVNTGLSLDDEFINDIENCIDGLFKFGLKFLSEKCFFKEKESISGKINFLSRFDKVKAEELKKKLSSVNWGF